MAKPPAKLSDRRPWPLIGDADDQILYASVGRALSQWERYEVALAILFATFVSPFDSYAARRAYVAVRTFEGRAEMLRAASSAYFDAMPDEALQTDFKSVLKSSIAFSARRNDIAHGVVDIFVPKDSSEAEGAFTAHIGDGFALYPSFASFKERGRGGVPTYCMASQELAFFTEQFELLIAPAIGLQRKLGDRWNSEVASRYKSIERGPA